MKTDLELALECAINIYHRYAIRNPMDDYLSRNEFAMLLKENAKPFLTDTVPVRCAAQRPSVCGSSIGGALLGHGRAETL